MIDAVQSLIETSRVADILIIVMLAEAAVLIGYRLVKARGFAVSHVVTNLLAGLFLVLALKAALASAPWQWIAASLALAGVAHAVDVIMRWPAT